MPTPLTPFLGVREVASRLTGSAADYDRLLEMARGKHYVLLGEATHGTSEFYRMRAAISRRLIAERQFDAVAVEGDWPDCCRVDRHVRGGGDDGASASGSLSDFQRFPRWMWRNTAVVDFVDWLTAHNASRPKAERCGFYGLDMYSLYRSADAVIDYLATNLGPASQSAPAKGHATATAPAGQSRN